MIAEKWINVISLAIFVLACIAVGAVSGMTASASSGYVNLNLPPLSPPGVLFPIAWTILYCLMGASLWLVYRSGGDKRYYTLFALQIALNFVWVPLFFGAKMMAIALIDLIALWIVVAIMIYMMYQKNRNAAYLLIPYIAWLTFAAYLNAGTLLMN